MLTFLGFVALFIYFIVRINQLETKINRLQGHVPAPPAEPNPTPVPPPTPAAIAKPELVLSKSEPIIQQAPKFTPAPASGLGADWEEKIGAKMFTIVGAIAVIFGVAFFLKYAFDHDLISESARIVLGIIVGLAILVTGQVTRKKYALYGQLLTGLGLGVLYLTIFAAFNYYHLISQPAAFLAMIITTGIGIALAITSDSEALAGFAQFGGFITPLLLSNGQNNPHGLFGYLFILDVVILVLSMYKPWKSLNLGSLIGTFILYGMWFATFYSPVQFGVAFGYLSLFFLVFLTASMIQYVVQKTSTDQKVLALLSLNTLFYYILSYSLINQSYHSLLGTFTFGLGILYLVLGFATMQKQGADDYFHNFMFGFAGLLFFIAIPVQFHKYAISIGWAAEALVLIVLGFQMKMRPIRYSGHVIFVITTLFTLIYSAVNVPQVAWTNVRIVNMVLIVLTMGIAAALYWDRKTQIDAETLRMNAFAPANEFMEAVTGLIFEAYLIAFWTISLEIWQFHEHYWMTIAWTIMAFLITMLGIKMKNHVLKAVGYISFLLVVFRLLFFESVVNLKTYLPLVNSRVGTFLFAIIALAIILYVLNRRQAEVSASEKELVIPSIFFGTNILMLWLVSFEVLDYFNQKAVLSLALPGQYDNVKNTSLSVAWILYAIIILIAGIVTKHRASRLFAFLLFAIVILKVFLYDTVSLNNLYRFISYFTLGIILLLAGYLYNRYKDRIIQFIKASN